MCKEAEETTIKKKIYSKDRRVKQVVFRVNAALNFLNYGFDMAEMVANYMVVYYFSMAIFNALNSELRLFSILIDIFNQTGFIWITLTALFEEFLFMRKYVFGLVYTAVVPS
jgi:hypothetical protein